MPQEEVKALPFWARLQDRTVFGAVEWVVTTHLRASIILVLVALAAFLPGLAGIAPLDRDEARFAQASRQMLETGDFVDIRLQDEPRYKKPVGIYWLQAATVTLAGYGADAPIWAHRLASVFGALAAVLLTYWAAIPLFGRMAAFGAALGMATSLLLTVQAHLATTDAALLATVVLAQGVLARAYLADESDQLPLRTALLFWAGLGFGFLLKGPIILMIAGLTAAALVAMDRRAGWLLRLRPAAGVPVAILIVLPWFAAILWIAGTDFLSASVGNDLLGKVTTGQESHWAPPGYHLVLFFFLFLPGPMLVPLALGPAWQARRDGAVKFCIAWLVPAWVVFELVATKLPHYTLPLYPAITMLIAGVAADGRLATGRWWTRSAILPSAFFVMAFAIAGIVIPERLEGVVNLPAVALSLAVVAMALAAVRMARADQPIAAGLMLAVAALVSYMVMFGLGLSRLDTFRLSPRIGEAVERIAACPGPKLVAAGYQEPSLVFATRTDIELVSGRAAADALAEGGCRVAMVEQKSKRSFLRQAARRGIPVEKVETLTGLSLGRLERLSVEIYRPAETSMRGGGIN